MEATKKVGENIRLIRKQRAMSQLALAVEIGSAQRCICEIERGLKSPTIRTLAKIAKVFNVPLEELVKERKEDEGK